MNIFDIDCKREEASLVMIPVPWEATTSYGKGTAYGPHLILKASSQQDLYDFYFKDNWRAGYFWQEIPEQILESSMLTRELCQKALEEEDKEALAEANKKCQEMNEYVYEEAKKVLAENKMPVVVGGDHSTPLGLIRALGEKYKDDYGILHIDAHADFRKAYQGFTYSHASIFYNVMTADFAPQKLVQVGIRDFCKEEMDFIKENESRIRTYFDPKIKERLHEGVTWTEQVKEMLHHLPDNVYISVDIDGFDPKLCPQTGTPVPGGLDFYEFQSLLRVLVGSGKKIIGFDLNEVSAGPDYDLENEWDGNIGMRILFQLCGWAIESQKQKEAAIF